MRKVKLVVHECYAGKRKSEEVNAAVFLSNAAALAESTKPSIIGKHNHYIYYDDLYAEVLKRVQNITRQIESGELLEQIQKQSAKRVKTDKLVAEQVKINKRLSVLKRIIKKLYEDFAADLLNSESYHSMLTDYANEQKQITARLAVIEAESGVERNDEQNVRKLKNVLDEYLNIETLTANMLNQLIE